MDNITLDLGSETAVSVGDLATLIGVDGAERQTAEQLARRIDTINYEVVCSISSRVPRAYHRDGTPA
jgi:alanine racemase